MYRSAQPLQELVNHATHLLSVGLLQFRPYNGIQRAIVEREKRQFYSYWCKAEIYLSSLLQGMTHYKILLAVISITIDQVIDRTQLEPLEHL